MDARRPGLNIIFPISAEGPGLNNISDWCWGQGLNILFLIAAEGPALNIIFLIASGGP